MNEAKVVKKIWQNELTGNVMDYVEDKPIRALKNCVGQRRLGMDEANKLVHDWAE